MPVTVRQALFDKDTEGQSFCYLCEQKLNQGERHLFWGIHSDKQFVLCSFHRAPTKIKIGLTVLYSFGYTETQVLPQTQLYKISKVDKRGKILNPATPSWLNVDQLIALYENPSSELVSKLIDENLHENRYWKSKSEEELKTKEVTPGEDGIRRGIRVLGLERTCSECGVTEAEMVAKNPRYTLCRGVCVVCYRKMYRGKTDARITNVSTV
jgi:hypothetical protein